MAVQNINRMAIESNGEDVIGLGNSTIMDAGGQIATANGSTIDFYSKQPVFVNGAVYAST